MKDSYIVAFALLVAAIVAIWAFTFPARQGRYKVLVYNNGVLLEAHRSYDEPELSENQACFEQAPTHMFICVTGHIVVEEL